jgi:spermidine dehydrogenase
MQAPATVIASPAKKLPYAILGPDWSGPGGIGDYANSNGNVFDTVNAAHALRDGVPLEQHVAADPDGIYDLVVVGGGISGLMTCYEFLKQRGPKAKVLAIDNHPIFGGEAKQNEVEIDGYRLQGPQGSNMFLWPPRTAAEITTFWHPAWEELGLPMEDGPGAPTWISEATGTSTPLAFERDNYSSMMTARERTRQVQFFADPKQSGRLVGTINPWERRYQDLPWPEEVREQLVRLDQFTLRSSPEQFEQWLDSMTYAEYLTKIVGVTRREVFDYLDPQIAAYGTGLGCEVVSACAAWHFRAPGFLRPDERKQREAGGPPKVRGSSFPGGNAGIARQILKRLIPDALRGNSTLHDVVYGSVNWPALDRPGQPIRMRLNSTAIDVRHDGPPDSARHALVTYVENKTGAAHRVRCKAVVMAGGQWMNKHVIRDAPPDLRVAMDSFNHAPMLVINVGVRHWRFMEKMGVTSARWFGELGWFTNVRAPMSIDGDHMPLDPNRPTILTFYNPYVCFSPALLDPAIPIRARCIAARQALLSLPYADIESAMRRQLTAAFGEAGFDAKRDIAAIIVNRWGHAYVALDPGFYFGKNRQPPPREVVQQGYGRVRFSHSELSGLQLWSTACAEGERAARQTLEFA